MQQRYYDPAIGRFLSYDPVSTNPNTGTSFNRYNYANNNPYRFTDPDGRQSRDVENEYKVSGAKPPPRNPDDKLGPAIGVALGGMVAIPIAVVAAPVVSATGTVIGGEIAAVDVAATQAGRQVLGVALAVVKHESKAAVGALRVASTSGAAKLTIAAKSIDTAVKTSAVVTTIGRNLDQVGDFVSGFAGELYGPDAPFSASSSAEAAGSILANKLFGH